MVFILKEYIMIILGDWGGRRILGGEIWVGFYRVEGKRKVKKFKEGEGVE